MKYALTPRRLALGGAISVLALISGIAGFGAAAKVADSASIAATTSAVMPRRVALIIANADYPDAGAPLKGTLDEAHNLARNLQDRGFDVEFEENVTKASLEQAVERLADKVKPGTTALISFSGYGIQVQHQNYLIPTDARIWTESDVARDGSNLTALLDTIGERGGDVTIAILDASRRNPFERRFRSVSAGLVSVATKRATLVMSTASPGKTIENADGQDHAIETLIDEMKGPQQDAETLFNRTKRRVFSMTKGVQSPTVSSSLVEKFTF